MSILGYVPISVPIMIASNSHEDGNVDPLTFVITLILILYVFQICIAFICLFMFEKDYDTVFNKDWSIKTFLWMLTPWFIFSAICLKIKELCEKER